MTESPKHSEETILEEIKKRLDALIRLSLLNLKEKISGRDQIMFLNEIGLKYDEIAKILGRSDSYVASELTVIKKRKKSKEV